MSLSHRRQCICHGDPHSPPRPGAASCATTWLHVAVACSFVATATFRLSLHVDRLATTAEGSVTSMSPEPDPNLARHVNTEAFPWDTAPRFRCDDRYASYVQNLPYRVRADGYRGFVTGHRDPPWETRISSGKRIIFSILREWSRSRHRLRYLHLRRVLSAYFEYHHRSRTHPAGKVLSELRPVQPPSTGTIMHFAKSRPAPSLRASRCVSCCQVLTASRLGPRVARTAIALLWWPLTLV